MKELKILAVVVFFTLVTYYGVEPYAHHQMHKKVDANGNEIVYENKGFTYPDLKKITVKGDAAAGKAMISACTGCHAIKSQKIKAPMDALASAGAYGVNPPDLSNVGALFDEQFLMHFIMDPTHTSMVAHKFKGGKVYPMPVVAPDPQTAANIVAYLKSIAPKVDEITPKEAFVTACGRCHADRYGKWTQIGDVPKTKPNIVTHQDPDMMKFKLKVADYQDHLAKYMGKLPPDLSIMIRARSEEFMENFIENPQSQLPGTAMPRVGLDKKGYEKVMAYLEETGDPSKPKRQAVGPWVLGFFFIFTILAYLWKRSQWKDLH
jgi:ubiquinol-cytochrome c reductase cytochrome c1 subunit